MRIKQLMRILLVALFLLGNCIPAFAAEGERQLAENQMIDSADQQIIIYAEAESKGISGIVFELYKIGDVDGDGNPYLADALKNYPLELDLSSAEKSQNAAFTLAGYLQNDDAEPLESGTTDENGALSFSVLSNGNNTGLYLLIGKALAKNNVLYTVSPMILSVSDHDEKPLEIAAKLSAEETSPKQLTVHKKWDNITDPSQKPESIGVTLLKNGTAIETVRLSEENQWTHTWYDLDGDAEWSCTETPVSGFQTVVQKDESCIIIKNTRISDLKGATLPYTGAVTWPYIFGAISGSMLLLTGILLKRKKGVFPVLCSFAGVLIVAFTGFHYANMLQKDRANEAARDGALKVLESEIQSFLEEHAEDASFNTGSGADENGYIGIIQIPELGICLPVTENWDYDKLETSACCYYGGPRESTMVIAGHSYKTYFRPLRNADLDQQVIFTDIYGKQTNYTVSKVEILQPEEVERMTDSGYDLTLFTCTSGGAARCAVRCSKSMKGE